MAFITDAFVLKLIVLSLTADRAQIHDDLNIVDGAEIRIGGGCCLTGLLIDWRQSQLCGSQGIVIDPVTIGLLIGAKAPVWFVAHQVLDDPGVLLSSFAWHIQVLVLFLS